MAISLSTIPAHSEVSRVNHADIVRKNLPPIGGAIIDSNVDIYPQVVDYIQQLGYEIPSSALQPHLISDNLDDIILQSKDLTREMERSEDRTSKALLKISQDLASLPRGASMTLSRPLPSSFVENGRSHIKEISEMIKNIHNGYQKDFGKVIKAATKYMQDVNTALGTISEFLHASENGKIRFQKMKFMHELDDAFKLYSDHSIVRGNRPKFSSTDAAQDDYFQDWAKESNSAYDIHEMEYSEAAFKFWKEKLGGKGFLVETRGKDKDMVIRIYPDLDPLRSVMKIVYTITDDWPTNGTPLLAQNIQSMQAAIDAQKNIVNNSVSRLLETFRQDNNHFDTLTQLLVQLIKDLNQYNNSLINI